MSKYYRSLKEREVEILFTSVDGSGSFSLITREEERIHVKLPEMPFVTVASNGSNWMRQCSILGNQLNLLFDENDAVFWEKKSYMPPCFLVWFRVVVLFRQVTSDLKWKPIIVLTRQNWFLSKCLWRHGNLCKLEFSFLHQLIKYYELNDVYYSMCWYFVNQINILFSHARNME